jgi:hypothetical protein
MIFEFFENFIFYILILILYIDVKKIKNESLNENLQIPNHKFKKFLYIITIIPLKFIHFGLKKLVYKTFIFKKKIKKILVLLLILTVKTFSDTIFIFLFPSFYFGSFLGVISHFFNLLKIYLPNVLQNNIPDNFFIQFDWVLIVSLFITLYMISSQLNPLSGNFHKFIYWSVFVLLFIFNITLIFLICWEFYKYCCYNCIKKI